SRRRHTRFSRDWSSDVCSSDLGMQQRVAIARALVNNPDIIFADEPIGNLDYNNGIAIMEIFKKLNTEYNKTIILVTHNEDMKKYGTRYLRLIDGKITEDEKVIR